MPAERRSAEGSDLFDRRNLDQEFLGSGSVEQNMRDALVTFTGDGVDAPFTEVCVTDAVPSHQFKVTIVANLTRDTVGPDRLRLLERRASLS